MNDIFYPLHLPEVGGMDQKHFAIGTNSKFKVLLSLLLKALQIDEIRNHLNVSLDVEVIVGLFSQVFRNSRYPVRLVDGKSNYRLVTRILSHQGDVCPMKGRHHWNRNTMGFEYLLGHVSRRSMRNGIMHMEQV